MGHWQTIRIHCDNFHCGNAWLRQKDLATASVVRLKVSLGIPNIVYKAIETRPATLKLTTASRDDQDLAVISDKLHVLTLM